ncbi:HAT, C-terminal dimerization domain [Dillenia turbinata]|uniref:HAT, C-terminal dimerization domain n=1 Tax=Dillenia turbinata TaxID=194707 RepID=A0AAN8ZB27_9MAGN
MGEPLLAAFLQTLLDKLDSGLLLNFARQEGFRSELRTWRSKLLQVRRVLYDAEEKQMSDREVKKWLDNLRDLAYNADDVLEELRHEALQRQNNSSSDSASSSSQVQDLLAQIQEITASFLDIEQDKSDLGLKERPGVRSSIITNRLPTTSLVDSSQIVGRKKDIDAILKLLDIGETTEAEENRNRVLQISILDKVKDVEDALVINLMNKKNIEELKFEWWRNLDNVENTESQVQILNLLEPRKMLRNLVIEGYCGVTLPNWIGDSSYSKLVKLSLINCQRCKLLPSLGQLPLLKKLTIKGMLEIETIPYRAYRASPHGQPFPSLIELRLENCENLRTLPDVIMSSNSNLQVLEIRACESLESFPSGVLPSNLKKLSIWDCRKLESISEMLLGPTSLHSVYFIKYPNLKSLPESQESQSLLPPTLTSHHPRVGQKKAARRSMYYDMFDNGVGVSCGSQSELDKYPGEICEEDTNGYDILGYWKLNSPRFPILSLMARDILAISISTVTTKSEFSTGDRILDAFWSSLNHSMVKALICAQGWFRT